MKNFFLYFMMQLGIFFVLVCTGTYLYYYLQDNNLFGDLQFNIHNQIVIDWGIQHYLYVWFVGGALIIQIIRIFKLTFTQL